MKLKNWSFSTKLYASICLVAVGATASSVLYFYVQTKDMLFTQMGNRLKDIGRTSRYLIEGEETQAIAKLQSELDAETRKLGVIISAVPEGEYREVLPAEVSSRIMAGKDFQNLVALLKKIKDATRQRLPNNTFTAPTIAYATILAKIPASQEPNMLQFLADADYDNEDAPNPVGNLFNNNSGAIAAAFDGVSIADTHFRNEEGQVLFSGAIPLRDANDQVIAVLALDYDALSEANQIARLQALCVAVIGGSFLLSILAGYILTRVLHRPIRTLREGAERVSQRDFDTQIELESRDELGMLAGAFNTMVKELKLYSSGLEEVNRAYARFVPKEFLEQLGRETITRVQLGDQVQKQMTILFSDIRSFTTISESMSPRDNFDFINEYLKAVSPCIRAQGGFIDKYIGDAVMALFPNSVENAVRAAIDMQKAVTKLNERLKEQGRPPIKIGIGLHNGNLMLGTVGEELRLNGTVISDAVNLASRLEGITKEFGAGIVISERVFNSMADNAPFHSRYLGQVVVKGKKNAVKIYEIIDGEEEDSARRKIISRADFERGVQAFERNQVLKARRLFRKVLGLHRGDTAAQQYLDKCVRLKQLVGKEELDKERKKLISVAGDSGKAK